jgi:hypothetical protein
MTGNSGIERGVAVARRKAKGKEMAEKKRRSRKQDRAGVASGQDCELCYEKRTGRSNAAVLRALSLGILMFAFQSLNVCWAQNKADEPAFPFTKSIFRWDYSCPTGVNCTFSCPGQATAAADHLSKLRLYLGTISIDGGQAVPAVFYEFSTREFPHASGFGIGSGLSILSCRALGMVLDHSGPPK